MRIHELFEAAPPLWSIERTTKKPGKIKRYPSLDQSPTARKGQGFHAIVRHSRKNPHVVVRQEREFGDKTRNAYLQWANTAERLMSSNPYLPRIYKIEREVDPENADFTRHRYELEKLIHPQLIGKKFPKELMYQLGDQMITNWPHNLRKQIQLHKLQHKTLTNEQIWNIIIYIIGDAIYHGQWRRLRDPLLRQAAKLTVQAQINTRGQWGFENPELDLYGYNVMARLTAAGPQVVITDPIG